MKNRRTLVTCVFFLSLASLLAYYYYLLGPQGYTQLEAINTAHQLCPAGIAYTICASLFFFTIFTIAISSMKGSSKCTMSAQSMAFCSTALSTAAKA